MTKVDRFFSVMTNLAAVVVLVLAFLLALFLSTAGAQEVDAPSYRIKMGAPCLLEAFANKVRSPCSVGYNPQTNNTLVRMNRLTMLIKRSEEPGAGWAYIVEDDGTLTPIATVVANGDCWVGHKFRFCAK